MRSGRRNSPFFTGAASSQLVPELVLIPFVASINQSEKARLGMLALLILTALVRSKAPGPATARQFTYLPAVAFLVIVALTFRDDLYKTAAVFVMIFVILLVLANTITRQAAYDSLLAGIALYLVANVLGWLAGVESPSISARIGGFETTSPFFSQRIIFPFAVSINEAPYVAACLLVSIVALIRMRLRPRWYQWLGLPAAVFVLLASGNRTATIIMILLGAALLLVPRATRVAVPYLAGLGLLLPFYVSMLRPLLEYLADLLRANAFLSRGKGANQLVDFEGRQATWSGSIKFWTDHFPGIRPLFFGYGYQGHVKSGAYLFIPQDNSTFLRDRSSLHAHNSILQSLFDAGLIGAVLLFTITVLIVYRYGRSMERLPIFAAATVVAFSGVVEPSLTPGILHIEAFLILYLAFFTPIRAVRAVRSSAAGSPRQATVHLR